MPSALFGRCQALCCALATVAALAAADAPSPATQKGSDDPLRVNTRSAKAIERLTLYYLEMYDKHLKSPDWIARSMGVISLARIDDARTTERLMRVMHKNPSLVTRAYAWEALHARRGRLTNEQRLKWVREAFHLGRQNVLRGDMRLGLLGIIDSQGPTARNKQLFRSVFENTNSMDPSDIRTLWKLGDMLKRWQSPDLIKDLIEVMSKLNHAYRAELVLRRVTREIPLSYRAPALPPEQRGDPKHSRLSHEGSKRMWRVTRRRWVDWFKAQQFQEIDPGEGGGYEGVSTLMPAGEKILDTADPKWRKDLELRRFRLGQVDVGFVVDSTASMGRVIRWIRKDVIKMMRGFDLVSREPRIGVVLYRDYGDAYIVKGIYLTGSARKLAAQLSDEGARGGGDMPEAVYEGLYTLIKKENWSKSRAAQKLVILVGDAPPQEKSMPKIEALIKASVDNGFKFHCIKVRTYHAAYVMRYMKKKNWDPKLTSFDRIAEWGKGKSYWVNFMAEYGHRRQGTARPPSKKAPDRLIFRNVLETLLEDDYRDRLDPFLNILMEYVEKPLPERRAPFGPASHRGGKHVPRDPQEQR